MSTHCRRALAAAVLVVVSHVSPVSNAAPPRGPVLAAADRVYALDLGGRVFEPTRDAAARESAYGAGKALRLVQFTGPTRQAWLDALAREGVTVLQYIPPYSYVVWADGASLNGAKSRSSALRWTGDFLPAYKTATVDAGLARGERSWHVMRYRGAQLDAAALRASGAVVGEATVIDHSFDVVEVQADAAAIESLSRLPGVYAISPVPRDGGLRGELVNQMSANNLGTNGLPVPGYLAWLATAGVKGTGVKVADVDGGIYDTHPDLVNRMLPCVGDTCGGSATDDHGTHTAGIIAGDGSSGTVDAAGFLRGLGVAPGAKLVEQLYEPTFTQPGGMLKLMRQSHDNGADLSSNSWGPAASPRGYDADTRQVDVGVRDTKPDVAGDQPMTYVVSIMNGDGGTSSQGTPDEAKNTLTVGSTKAQVSSLAADPGYNDVSSNSGAGPALDGRRIPHVVAPGCRVDSIISATAFGLMCGTSMAAPHVAGAAALFIEKYRASYAGASPSAALIKAAVVAAAQDLAGRSDADGNVLGHRPDSKQGWGRVRTDWLLGPAVTQYWDQDTRTFDDTGDEWTASVAQADPTKPMQMVLVWTDAPGHGLGGSTPAWNNDLDLAVDLGATKYRGNVFGPDGNSVAGGSADDRNNIESVILPAASANAGPVTVRVTASNLNSDGVPNAGDATDQDFALVCVNCTVQSNYTLSLRHADRAICKSTTPSTSYDIAVDPIRNFNDAVNLSLTGLPGGVTGSISPATVTPPGTAVATLAGLDAAATGAYVFQLHAEAAPSSRDLQLALTLADAPPAGPSRAAPADQAADVPLRPAFRWTAAPQAADHELEVATDAAFANVVFRRAGKETTATPPTDLESGTPFWWRVRSSNACGTGAWSAAGTFTTLAGPGDCPAGKATTPLFSDNVENGTNGWTAAAATGDEIWALSTARATSGTHAWLAQDLDTESDQRLTSPAIALPAGRSPLTLRFMSDQKIERKSGGTGCWDGGFLEISTDGGTTFQAIPPAAMLTDPYDGALDSGNPAGGTPAWCGDPQPWTRSVVNLDAYAGQTVRLRFRLASDAEVGRAPDGWYVDDVKVQGCADLPADSIFANGFE